MSSRALLLGELEVPASADVAQVNIRIGREAKRRRGDRETEILMERIAAAYRLYHAESGPSWVESRQGVRRLRVFGTSPTELAPRRSHVSVDLEDFQ